MKFRLLEADDKWNYTDAEIATFDQAKLEELINNNVGDKSHREKYILAWLEKKYDSKWDKLKPASASIVAQIYDEGINDNPFITFLDEYSNTATVPDLTPEVAMLVDDLISSYTLDAEADVKNADYLYAKETYNEGKIEDIIYKIKAYVFTNDKANKRKFGLPDNIYDIIKDKSATDIKTILASYQSKNGEGDTGLSIVAKEIGKSPTKEDLKKYLIDLSKEPDSKLNEAEVTTYLDSIINDRFSSDWKDIVNLFNNNYKDSKDGSISAKDQLDQKLVAYLRDHAKNQKEESTGSSIIASYYSKDSITEDDIKNYLIEIGTELGIDEASIISTFDSIKGKRLDPKWSTLTTILNEKFKDKDSINAKDQLDQKLATFLSKNVAKSSVTEETGKEIILKATGKDDLKHSVLKRYIVKIAKEAGINTDQVKEFYDSIKGNRLDSKWTTLVALLNKKYKSSESGDLKAKDYFDQDLVKFLSKNVKETSKKNSTSFSPNVEEAINKLVASGEKKREVIDFFTMLKEDGVNINNMSVDNLISTYNSRKSA